MLVARSCAGTKRCGGWEACYWQAGASAEPWVNAAHAAARSGRAAPNQTIPPAAQASRCQEPNPKPRPSAGAPGAVAGHADGKPGANGKAGADAKAQANGKGKAPAAGAAGGGTSAAPSVPGFAPGEGVRESAPPYAPF